MSGVGAMECMCTQTRPRFHLVTGGGAVFSPQVIHLVTQVVVLCSLHR